MSWRAAQGAFTPALPFPSQQWEGTVQGRQEFRKGDIHRLGQCDTSGLWVVYPRRTLMGGSAGGGLRQDELDKGKPADRHTE